MTPTIPAGLLRPILENPADDQVRLVCADWLETEGGQPERAEFIRVQCELAKLPEPHWEVVADPDGLMWRVRWSEPDSQRRYQWVRHYATEEVPARHFAERDAETMTRQGRRPEERGFLPVSDGLRRRQEELLTAHTAEWIIASPPLNKMLTGGRVPNQLLFTPYFDRGFVDWVRCQCADWREYGPAIVAVQPVTKLVLSDAAPSFDFSISLNCAREKAGLPPFPPVHPEFSGYNYASAITALGNRDD